MGYDEKLAYRMVDYSGTSGYAISSYTGGI